MQPFPFPPIDPLVWRPDERPRPWLGDLVVVSRRIDVAAERLASVLSDLPEAGVRWPLGRTGELQLQTRLTREPGLTATWQARARLRGGRLRRSLRIEISISAWSGAASELRVRPTSRSAHHWAPRRLRRYLALARPAADDLERRLVRAARRPPASPVGVAAARPHRVGAAVRCCGSVVRQPVSG